MVRDNVARDNARFIPDRSHRMGSRHRSAVTTSMPLTPITLITEVRRYYISDRDDIASGGISCPIQAVGSRFMMAIMVT